MGSSHYGPAKFEKEEKDKRYHRIELPRKLHEKLHGADDADHAKVSAEFKDGTFGTRRRTKRLVRNPSK
jgi:hypothetical protein